MTDGGERDSLAPVIPLFGGPMPRRPEPARVDDETDGEVGGTVLDASDDAASVVEGGWTEIDTANGRRGPGSAHAGSAAVHDMAWHPTWTSERARLDARDAARSDTEADGGANVDLAEKALLKKLRTRSLSVSEARGILREHDLDDAAIESVIASMDEYGYVDDAALADQLVHAGVDRKGQGRQLIAQTLAKRGIPRDVADAALAALPDDDLERALEFARGKARSMRDLDRDTALRRLSGQLARRGYSGSLAMTAARIALDEGPRGSSGVRFR